MLKNGQMKLLDCKWEHASVNFKVSEPKLGSICDCTPTHQGVAFWTCTLCYRVRLPYEYIFQLQTLDETTTGSITRDRLSRRCGSAKLETETETEMELEAETETQTIFVGSLVIAVTLDDLPSGDGMLSLSAFRRAEWQAWGLDGLEASSPPCAASPWKKSTSVQTDGNNKHVVSRVFESGSTQQLLCKMRVK